MTAALEARVRGGSVFDEQIPDGGGPVSRSAFGDVAAAAMRVHWLWPVLLTLLAGLYHLTRPELWRDELSSWSFASRPVGQLVTIVHHSDATQLPYYLLLHYWIAAFGDSVAAMRMLSVLAMAGAAACVTLVGSRLAGRRAGLVAGLVFALIPSVSRFAQETRFYALEVLAGMLATLLLLRAIERPGWLRWVLYALSVAALGYVDVVALAVLAGHAAGVALCWWRTRELALLGFIAAAVAGCAACLPIITVGLGQAGGQLSWLGRPDFTMSAFAFFGRNLFYSTATAAALIIVAVLAWAVAWRAAAFASAIAVLPVAALWALSQGSYSYFFPRYLLLTVGAWAILAGVALSRLNWRVALASVIVIGILGAGDQQAIRDTGAHSWAQYPVAASTSYWDYQAAARVVASHVQPGDGIAYPAAGVRWLMIDYGVQYYLQQDLAAARRPGEVFVAESAAAAGTLYSQLTHDPAAVLAGAGRVWTVVDGGGPYNGLLPGQRAALEAAGFHVELARHVAGLTIFLLVR
jgi:mannosyltransferase